MASGFSWSLSCYMSATSFVFFITAFKVFYIDFLFVQKYLQQRDSVTATVAVMAEGSFVCVCVWWWWG